MRVGQVDTLRDSITPSFSTSRVTVGGATALTRSSTAPSSMSTSSPGLKCGRSSGKLTGSWAPGGAPEHHGVTGFDIERPRQVRKPQLGARQVDEDCQRCARSTAARRTAATDAACSAVLPCARLMRATSMPASSSSPSTRSSRDAGPSVATIFVRRRIWVGAV